MDNIVKTVVVVLSGGRTAELLVTWNHDTMGRTMKNRSNFDLSRDDKVFVRKYLNHYAHTNNLPRYR